MTSKGLELLSDQPPDAATMAAPEAPTGKRRRTETTWLGRHLPRVAQCWAAVRCSGVWFALDREAVEEVLVWLCANKPLPWVDAWLAEHWRARRPHPAQAPLVEHPPVATEFTGDADSSAAASQSDFLRLAANIASWPADVEVPRPLLELLLSGWPGANELPAWAPLRHALQTAAGDAETVVTPRTAWELAAPALLVLAPSPEALADVLSLLPGPRESAQTPRIPRSRPFLLHAVLTDEDHRALLDVPAGPLGDVPPVRLLEVLTHSETLVRGATCVWRDLDPHVWRHSDELPVLGDPTIGPGRYFGLADLFPVVEQRAVSAVVGRQAQGLLRLHSPSLGLRRVRDTQATTRLPATTAAAAPPGYGSIEDLLNETEQ